MELAEPSPRSRTLSRKALVPEATRVAVEATFDSMAVWLRHTWLYRLTLYGPIPRGIRFYLEDPRLRSLEDAEALMHGRFRMAGQTFDVKEGSIFDCTLTSDAFAAMLHGFEWLRHLEAAGSEVARDHALGLTASWLERNFRYAMPAWRAEVTAERLLNLFSHGQFFLEDADPAWRLKLFSSLRDQVRMLARAAPESPSGLPRFKCAAALALAGLCLEDARTTATGLRRLVDEIDAQILPDGGHVSRSPSQCLEALRVLLMVQSALAAGERAAPPALDWAVESLTAMLRFFRLGDGALSVANGGTEEDARVVAALLAGDSLEEPVADHAPHSCFHRLGMARTVVLMDAGAPPPSPFSCSAHAAALAFEMSTGGHRMIVNCGSSISRDKRWEAALRSTPAHSTLTLGDTSQAAILGDGALCALLGPRLIGGPTRVSTRRLESAHGLSVEGNHDAYVQSYGLVHQRRMTLARGGHSLAGADRVIPVQAKAWTTTHDGKGVYRGLPFAIRFHIHPDVRLSMAQGGASVLLKLPNGEGWRFRCGGSTLSVEESIYFGGGSARRAEQLVLSANVKNEPIEAAWVFEQMGSS